MNVPLLNASGCLDALAAPQVANRFDVFVTKTITPLARQGNPTPRIAETDHGMLNSIGLQGPGLEAFVATNLPRLRELLQVHIWVSVGGFSVDDYVTMCERLDGEAAIEALELNLSCPNVEEAPEGAGEIVAAARRATGKPLFAKLSPAAWDIAESARAVVAAGADGLTLVNTLKGLALDEHTGAPRLARGVGGYSGPGLRPAALACVYSCANAVDVPIVGMGGVSTARHALDLVRAGASAVGIGTALFSDPGCAHRIRSDLEALPDAPMEGVLPRFPLRAVVRLEKHLQTDGNVPA